MGNAVEENDRRPARSLWQARFEKSSFSATLRHLTFGPSGLACGKPTLKFMKCELCGKNDALVHLTQTKADVSEKVHLCEACAKLHGVNDPAGFSLVDIIEKVKHQRRQNRSDADSRE